MGVLVSGVIFLYCIPRVLLVFFLGGDISCSGIALLRCVGLFSFGLFIWVVWVCYVWVVLLPYLCFWLVVMCYHVWLCGFCGCVLFWWWCPFWVCDFGCLKNVGLVGFRFGFVGLGFRGGCSGCGFGGGGFSVRGLGFLFFLSIVFCFLLFCLGGCFIMFSCVGLCCLGGGVLALLVVLVAGFDKLWCTGQNGPKMVKTTILAKVTLF